MYFGKHLLVVGNEIAQTLADASDTCIRANLLFPIKSLGKASNALELGQMIDSL
jgi:hypothetical protein